MLLSGAPITDSLASSRIQKNIPPPRHLHSTSKLRRKESSLIVVPALAAIEHRRFGPNWPRLNGPILAAANKLAPDPVWVIDDRGFPKQGHHSVGVARQYSGTLGKTANCQVAVSLHQAGGEESILLGWRLYLPESWTQDAQRRAEAGIPAEVKFQTKWQLALELIDEGQAWGLRCGVVLADCAYGEVTEFRQGLTARQLPYAVGIPSTLGVWTRPPRLHKLKARGRGRPPSVYHYGEQRPCAVREVAEKARGWKQGRWREGTKAWLQSRFYACRVRPSHGFHKGQPRHPEVWLLVEWPPGEKEPTKSFLCDWPEHYSLRRLVRIVKGRWKIEQDYQQLKEELGLDHYEGRNWTGWHHHVTLVILAHAFLTLERVRSKKSSGWTLPQTRREIQRLLFTWTGECAYCGSIINKRNRPP